MERIIKKILVTTGICLSLAVALLPLTSYAVAGLPNEHGFGCDNSDSAPCATDNGSVLVSVTTIRSISIDAADTEVIKVSPAMAVTGTLSVNVKSTMAYTISLSADVPFLQNTEAEEFVIPSSSNITAGKSAWGIKKQNAAEYSAITTNPEVFYTGTATDRVNGANVDFEVGVSASSKLPQGRYSTKVNITATIKE